MLIKYYSTQAKKILPSKPKSAQKSAHRPQHVDLPDDTEHTQEPTDESDDAILAAIKTCAEANGHVSADDLLDLMDKTHPGEYPVSRIMRELGSLELEGRISMRSGWIIAEQR